MTIDDPVPTERVQKKTGGLRRRISERFAAPLDALQIIREADIDKSNATLEGFVHGEDSVEHEILDEMRSAPSLADTDTFLHHHRTFIRALEI